ASLASLPMVNPFMLASCFLLRIKPVVLYNEYYKHETIIQRRKYIAVHICEFLQGRGTFIRSLPRPQKSDLLDITSPAQSAQPNLT
ncbi:MAG: hypothetical protein MUO63_14490, partial [Desulfobulbaceae bacterium]|nr:hypothetical protein [Desulfobulbaceae bacterium]